ncbi:helix-turn-helix domain-containing protein, partial [Acinetobacter baumannii]
DLTTRQINKEIKIDEAVGLGRNCCVFHTVRHWAYVEVRQYRAKSFNQWLDCVIAQCCSVNAQFTVPMQYNEVKGIAKSIARWVWKRDGYAYQEFIDRQTRKGQLGGKAKGEAYNAKRKQAVALRAKGMNHTQIAKQLGIARYTVIRWLGGVSQ